MVSVLLIHHLALLLKLSNDLHEVGVIGHGNTRVSLAHTCGLIFTSAVFRDNRVLVPKIKTEIGQIKAILFYLDLNYLHSGHETIQSQCFGSSLRAGVKDELKDTL